MNEGIRTGDIDGDNVVRAKCGIVCGIFLL